MPFPLGALRNRSLSPVPDPEDFRKSGEGLPPRCGAAVPSGPDALSRFIGASKTATCVNSNWADPLSGSSFSPMFLSLDILFFLFPILSGLTVRVIPLGQGLPFPEPRATLGQHLIFFVFRCGCPDALDPHTAPTFLIQ